MVDAPARIEVGRLQPVCRGAPCRCAGWTGQPVCQAAVLGVDFQRDVVASDRFSLVFERKIAETGEVRTGKLLYAALMLKNPARRWS
ncbi:hypothetical protein E6W36_10030 [Hankyongella ginsenosidimutans]|uniref:Uncharacterized protein n=1 Tax=Hankyongella ginsenosidimutans TaxID=1763828 RepID=A0A4D7BWD8_9SPHN|nr:hypothetical protein [Hankyongella ginsenosidimutans]QCI79749.1 hypothetical protein E6W36_10030 [Hankyongella ginsenosidimutans]